MGIIYRKQILLKETVLKNCDKCKKVFSEGYNYCKDCGGKLSLQKSKVYANFGKNGVTSISYKMSNGITINSKGNVTIPLSQGLSYKTTNKTTK